jgi:putative endonuclease
LAKHLETGRLGENLAVHFLETEGYRILHRNYRFGKGEADIIAWDEIRNEVVFVEVKTRSRTRHEYHEQTVSKRKKQLLFQLADEYQYQEKLTRFPCRFDVIAIDFNDGSEPNVYHIFDAFREDRSAEYRY